MKKVLFLLLFLLPGICWGKSSVQLRDSVTGEILPFATIITKEGRKRSFVADENGVVIIPENLRHTSLESVYTGYSNKPFTLGATDTFLFVKMSPTEYDLEEVFIKPKKEKYSKKK